MEETSSSSSSSIEPLLASRASEALELVVSTTEIACLQRPTRQSRLGVVAGGRFGNRNRSTSVFFFFPLLFLHHLLFFLFGT